MDSLITAAARSLAAVDPLAALNRIALRDDPPEPTVRHGADLGLIPVVVRDACGAGHAEAAERSLANIAFVADAIMIDAATITGAMAHAK